MAFLHIDTHIDLFRSASTSVEAGSGSCCAVYLSELTLNGHIFPFTVAHPLQKPGAVALPPATNAYLSGNLHVDGRSLMVAASELIPLYVATTPATRAAAAGLYTPYISLAGVVSSERVMDVTCPAALVVDVTVNCTDRSPAHCTIIRCYFNRDEKRFRTLVPLVPGMPVILSGKLFGWAGGKLAIDVDEISCNNLGEIPSRPLALYPCPFARCSVIQDYGVFTDPPPAYASRALTSSPETPSLIIDVSDTDDDSDCSSGKGASGAVEDVAESTPVERSVRSRRIRRRGQSELRGPPSAYELSVRDVY